MRKRSRNAALAFLGGAAAGLALLSLAAHGEAAPTVYLHLDYGYDVSDARLVAGDATAVIVGTVEARIGQAYDRTVFEVTVQEELEGKVPASLLVSQLGFEAEDGTHYRVEGFPLMEIGRTYAMALVAPSSDDPAEAMVLLTAPAGGNLVAVDDSPSGRRNLAVFERAVASQTQPDNSGAERRARQREWDATRADQDG